MGTGTLADNQALDRLVDALRAIVEVLHHWQAPEPSGEVPAESQPYDLGQVATAFEEILIELKEKSGPDGHEVYERFGAIARHLRAAADGFQEEHDVEEGPS